MSAIYFGRCRRPDQLFVYHHQWFRESSNCLACLSRQWRTHLATTITMMTAFHHWLLVEFVALIWLTASSYHYFTSQPSEVTTARSHHYRPSRRILPFAKIGWCGLFCSLGCIALSCRHRRLRYHRCFTYDDQLEADPTSEGTYSERA